MRIKTTEIEALSQTIATMTCDCGGRYKWEDEGYMQPNARCQKCNHGYHSIKLPSTLVTLPGVADIRMEFRLRGAWGNTSVVLFSTKTFPRAGTMEKDFTTDMHPIAGATRFNRTRNGDISISANRGEYGGSQEDFDAAVAVMIAKFTELLASLPKKAAHRAGASTEAR